MLTEPRAQGRVGVLPENVAGALAYFTFIPAILFLVIEPYKKNRFVRFHSVQCLLLWGASGLFAIALKLASVVLFIIPVLGPLLVWLVSTVVVLAAVVIWVVLVVKVSRERCSNCRCSAISPRSRPGKLMRFLPR